MLRQPQRNTMLMLRAFNQNNNVKFTQMIMQPSQATTVTFSGSRMFATKKADKTDAEVEEKPKKAGRPKKVVTTSETEGDLPVKKARKPRVTKKM